MKVRAIEMGFYDGSRKKPGDVFILPAGVKPASWMESLEAPAEQPKAVEKVKAEKPKAEQPKAVEKVKAEKPKAEQPKAVE